MLAFTGQSTSCRMSCLQTNGKDNQESRIRSVTQVECYSSLLKVPQKSNLLAHVDGNSECILLPIMGVYIPFHITTIKGVSYSQDGEAQDKVHSYVRIQFNTMASYDARIAFPKAALIKELSFRSVKPEAAHRFVQVWPVQQRGLI
jgi:nucleosome binding factor SPN SPT16 subunit